MYRRSGWKKLFSPAAIQAGDDYHTDDHTPKSVRFRIHGCKYIGYSAWHCFNSCWRIGHDHLWRDGFYHTPRTVSLTGGTIPAGSITNPGTCTITVQATTPAGASAATYTNIIPANSLTTNQGVTNVLPATAPIRVYTVGTGILSSKAFSPSTIDAGGNSRLRINMRAPADTALTNFSLTDILPPAAGAPVVVISNSQGPNVTNCGPGYPDSCDRGEHHYPDQRYDKCGCSMPDRSLGNQQHAG